MKLKSNLNCKYQIKTVENRNSHSDENSDKNVSKNSIKTVNNDARNDKSIEITT